MLNWKKSFLLLGIKFRGHTKEEAKQQSATWVDFLTRKKYAKKNIPSHIRKTAAGFLAIKHIKTFYWCRNIKQWRMHLTVIDTELKHLDWFLGFSKRGWILQNKAKNLFCQSSLPRTCMKTCRLSAQVVLYHLFSFFKSSAGGILRIISLFWC